ncbi:hypothetical protein Bbelb_019000 [Branchiostoma belcheri]|nr:hypothetical protein Bbelb_019000 [Branchiostoma belcheri]
MEQPKRTTRTALLVSSSRRARMNKQFETNLQAVKYNQQLPADLTDLFEDNIQIDDFERAYNGRHRQGEHEDDYDHILIGDTSSHTRFSEDPVVGRGSATSISPRQDYGKLLFTRFTDNNPIPGATNEVQYGGEIQYYWIGRVVALWLHDRPQDRNLVVEPQLKVFSIREPVSLSLLWTVTESGSCISTDCDGGKSTRLAEEKVPAKRRKKYPNRADRWSDARLLLAGLNLTIEDAMKEEEERRQQQERTFHRNL